MIKQDQWEDLDGRAARAIARSRALIEARRRIMEEMAATYRQRYLAARKAYDGVQKTEGDLVANYKRWMNAGI